MTKNVNASGATAEAPVKKVRRGVSNETKATAKLRFHEKDAAPNGLFMAHLHSVTVAWSVNADSKQFSGEKVPRLVFEFASNTSDASQRRYVDKTLFPVESNVDTIPGGDKDWQVNSLLTWIKHILDIYYLKGRQLTEEEENALSLPFVDFDEEGNYIAIDVKEVLNGYAQLFNNVAAMLNGTYNLADGETAKPCFRDDNGKFLRCWIKLLRHIKNKGEWKNVSSNGDLSFTQFVGTGAIELSSKADPHPKILSVDTSKESITPKEIKKTPSIPGIAGIGGDVVAGGGIIPPGNANAYNEAAEEMPF